MTDEVLDCCREAVEKLKQGGSSEYELNLACWLGERSHHLLAEIERLRAELAHQEHMRAELRDALTEAAQSLGIDPDGMDDIMVLRAIVAQHARKT